MTLGEVAEWLKAAVSKTVMGHWPIESSNLSLSAIWANRVAQHLLVIEPILAPGQASAM